MGENSRISWTEHTFSPWWGCTKISPACDFCYAERWARRVGFPSLWSGERRVFGEKHWREPLKWNARAERAGRRARVFCASMADIFDGDAPSGERERLWALIEATPSLMWLLLTKRIGNAPRMLPQAWLENPRPNVWLGATFCNQIELDRDLCKLLAIPAVVHFGSFEPLLGPVRLPEFEGKAGLSWIIAGGESGPHARPSHPDWFRGLRDQCISHGIPFHFKQWGEWLPGEVFSKEGPQGLAGGFCRHQDGTEGVHVGMRDHWWTGDAFGGLLSSRVGVKIAGRLLDGRSWDEMPQVNE